MDIQLLAAKINMTVVNTKLRTTVLRRQVRLGARGRSMETQQYPRYFKHFRKTLGIAYAEMGFIAVPVAVELIHVKKHNV